MIAGDVRIMLRAVSRGIRLNSVGARAMSSGGTMDAVRVHKWLSGPSELQIDRIPVPDAPQEGQYEVDIRAIGCNFYDVLQIQGKYQFKPPFPFIPGNEFSGVVTRRGPGPDADYKFNVGDRVFGSEQGAYTERITCSETSLMAVPPSLSFEQAAGISVTYPTSHYALTRRGHVKAGETVLVHAAAGGVGLAACQVAKSLGATVIATAGSPAKLAVAKERGGADHAINYRDDDWIQQVKDLTDGGGVDVVYDPVGLVTESSKCIAWNGRILVIGFVKWPGGKGPNALPTFPVNRALIKGCSIVGVFYGRFMMTEPEENALVWDEINARFADGSYAPVVYDQPFDGLASASSALQALADRQTFGKAVIRPGAGGSKL